jgi:hypothetical protein
MLLLPVVGLSVIRLILLFIDCGVVTIGRTAVLFAELSCRWRSFVLARIALYLAALADWLVAKIG